MESHRRTLKVLLILFYPLLLTLLTARLAFTEKFVEFLYARVDLPPDPMPYELRLSIAKMGLRAVLSEKGMEEFKSSGLFNEREVRHMKDVKKLLDVFFGLLYLGLPLWIVGLLSLKRAKDMGKVLLFGAMVFEAFVIFVVVASVLNYEWLFEAFHNLFFDPYSWRFRDEDMLIRVYPMDFWFKATIYSALVAFCINLTLQAFGLYLWKKRS